MIQSLERLKMRKLVIALTLVIAIGNLSPMFTQTGVDRDLLNEIYKIKAIDNHAHPLKHVAEGEKPDDEYDALPLDAITVFPLPIRVAPSNPEFIHAWKQLY